MTWPRWDVRRHRWPVWVCSVNFGASASPMSFSPMNTWSESNGGRLGFVVGVPLRSRRRGRRHGLAVRLEKVLRDLAAETERQHRHDRPDDELGWNGAAGRTKPTRSDLRRWPSRRPLPGAPRLTPRTLARCPRRRSSSRRPSLAVLLTIGAWGGLAASLATLGRARS